MALPLKSQNALWALLGLIVAAWLIEVVSLFFLQKSCQHRAESSDIPPPPTPFDWPAAAQLPATDECGKAYRYLWWIAVFEFPIVAGMLASLLGGLSVIRRWRFGWLTLLGVSTALHFWGANVALNLTDTHARAYETDLEILRAKWTLFGFSALSAINILTILVLGDDGEVTILDQLTREPLLSEGAV
jgi:hypothetical protein